jgi:hypothetical protein
MPGIGGAALAGNWPMSLAAVLRIGWADDSRGCDTHRQGTIRQRS